MPKAGYGTQTPRKIVSKGGGGSTQNGQIKRGVKAPIEHNVNDGTTSNLTVKPKKEEGAMEPSRKRLRLEHKSSSARIKPEILINAGIRASCIGEPIFNQLGISRSSLGKEKETIITPKGKLLESLGTVNLMVPCRCYKLGCWA